MTTLHLVTHTHWDREWYRTFQQFRLKLVHMIDGVLDLLEEDRDFKYFMLDGQTVVIDDYLTMRPENEARLRRFIRSGRIVIGPWHILPDEFLVSPEATLRNLLAGTATCARFGPRMEIGYIPDPFGHLGQMPQILNGFDIQAACVQRGLSDERCEFWWQAPDGSRLFMAYLRDGYGNAAGLPAADPVHFTSEVRRLRDSLLPHANSNQHLLLMHGTDHTEPHPSTSAAIAATRGHLDGDKLVHSTLPKYIAAVRASLQHDHIPTVSGELRSCKRSHLLPGVLSARLWIKQRNHASETLLEKWAEPFSTWAELFPPASPPTSALRQPAGILRQTWRLLMENHPHDSICGCSIDQVHDEMKVRFDQVDQIGEEITLQSLTTLAANVNTLSAVPTSNSAIVVFNPLSHPRTDLVSAQVDSATAFELRDQSGALIPFESQGLGSQELIHADLTPRELQSLYTAVHDGRVMGLSVIDLKITPSQGIVHLDAYVSETLPPKPRVWQQGVAELEKLIADPQVKIFRVRALSLDSSRIRFSASQVPGLGWKTFTIHPLAPAPKIPRKVSPLSRLFLPLLKLPLIQKLAARPKKVRLPLTIENETLSLTAQRDGTLTLLDKNTGALFQDLNRFVDGGDCGDEYNYCPPENETLRSPRVQYATLQVGAVTSAITLHMHLPTPVALAPGRKARSKQNVTTRITSTVSLTSGSPRVDIQTILHNHARDHRLRVHFASPFSVETAEHDGHFEIVERPTALQQFDHTWVEQPRPEVPQRAFTMLAGPNQRLTIANRGLPEVEVLQTPAGHSEVALTLLRCVGWLSRDDFSNRRGHAGPFLETPGAQMLGTWDYDYAIFLLPDPLAAAQSAYASNVPLRATATGLHPGSLPSNGSFVQVAQPQFVVSAIKETEDKKGWLVRGYNLIGEEIQVSMLPWRPFKRAEVVNLAEKKQKALRPSADGSVHLPLRGHGILTIKFSD